MKTPVKIQITEPPQNFLKGLHIGFIYSLTCCSSLRVLEFWLIIRPCWASSAFLILGANIFCRGAGTSVSIGQTYSSHSVSDFVRFRMPPIDNFLVWKKEMPPTVKFVSSFDLCFYKFTNFTNDFGWANIRWIRNIPFGVAYEGRELIILSVMQWIGKWEEQNETYEVIQIVTFYRTIPTDTKFTRLPFDIFSGWEMS